MTDDSRAPRRPVAMACAVGLTLLLCGLGAPSARADERLQQGSKLTSGGASAAEFGAGVALSSEGTTALIGGTEGTFVYVGSGSHWTRQASLPAGQGRALSADGSTALIASSAGTYVFTRSKSSWTQQALLATGASVALSANGSTAVVGSPAAGEHSGASLVFTRSGKSWSQTAELTSGDAGASEFGYSVAISGDGHTALVGGPGHTSQHPTGAAWVFVVSLKKWAAQGAPIAGADRSELFTGLFGTSVALSFDGGTALIGGDNRVGGVFPFTPYEGAAWAYTRSGSTWAGPDAELVGEGDDSSLNRGHEGESVALSADGNTALIGGGLDAGLGAAWRFTRTGSGWDAHARRLQASDSVGVEANLFGAAVALASSGDVALIGDPRDDGGLGAAWIFAATPAVTALDPSAGPTEGGTPVAIAGTNFTGASAVHFGTVPAPHFTVTSENSITAESPAGAGTSDVTVTTPEGTSLSSSSDQFSYGLAITGMSPDSGSMAGGTSVAIAGTGFAGAKAVRFGSRAAVNFTINSDTSITATAPPGSGTVDVSVTTGEGQTPTTAADLFGYANLSTYSTGAGRASLGQIITGQEGDLWFIASSASIGRITPQGAVTQYAAEPGIRTIASAKDGRIWFFAERAGFPPSYLNYLTPEGELGEGCDRCSTFPESLTRGPDGEAWYTGYDDVEEDVLVEETNGTGCCGLGETHGGRGAPQIAGGADDDLWISWENSGILRADLAAPFGKKLVRQYPVGAGVTDMAADSNDDLWFTQGRQIVRLDQAGDITRFSQGIAGPTGAIAAGPEGDMWFTEPTAEEIGRITPQGAVTQFATGSAPEGITVGSEGDIWFTEESGGIGRITVAEPPEFGRCLRVAGDKVGGRTVYDGLFAGPTCLVASPAGAGRYEWYPGVVEARFATTLKSGVVMLQTTAKTKVTCHTENGTGEYTGPRSVGNLLVKFTGCESGDEACTTEGLAAGEMQSARLDGTLGLERIAVVNGKEVRHDALDLSPADGSVPFMKYRCVGGAPITVTGSLLVPVASDRMQTTSTENYIETAGKQKPERFEGGPLDVLTASLNGEVQQQMGVKASLTLSSEEAVELNAGL